MNCLRTTTARAVRTLSVPKASAVIPAAAARHSSSVADAYKSPFADSGPRKETTKIPDFGKYRSPNVKSNQVFGYFMVGTMGALTAAGAKATVQGKYTTPFYQPVTSLL